MSLQPGVTKVSRVAVDDVRAELDAVGGALFVLPPTGIVDRAAFFEAARAVLPLDPPVLGNRSWDALSDSLWEGLHERPESTLVIVWPNAREMARHDPVELALALEVLASVSTQLRDARATVGVTKDLCVLVEMDVLDPSDDGMVRVSIVGRRIEGLARVHYAFDGQVDRDHGALELRIGGAVFSFDGDGDGERLRIVEGPWQDPFEGPLSPENQEYVREHGTWVRFDYTREQPYADFVDQPITEVVALVNRFGRVGGVRISVPGRSLWFTVESDEAFVSWTLPAGFAETGDAPSRP